MTERDDDMLEDIFAQARAVSPDPPPDLMARVLADAAAQSVPQSAPMVARGLWARMLEGLGGWPAVSGLAAATVAGVWIGVAPPASVQDLTATLVGDAVTVSLFSDDAFFDLEEFADG